MGNNIDRELKKRNRLMDIIKNNDFTVEVGTIIDTDDFPEITDIPNIEPFPFTEENNDNVDRFSQTDQ